MKITYLGHSSFKIETNDKTIVIDPYNPDSIGLPWKETEADVVLVSHHHDDHNYVEGISGHPFVIDSPGEYEVSDIRIQGLPAYHDAKQGEERGVVTLFLIESEGIYLGHFGDIGHPLEEEQQERLGVVDIALVPIGGVFTINHEQASNMIAQIEPFIAIPMHYLRPGSKTEEWGFAPLEEFLSEMGVDEPETQKVLKITNKSNLPEETEIVILEPQFS
ncbi:MBL fold metallo-hydrolase [candidate division WWE3 bacterium]|uniref:MBL fold metallo-hydrolase n=1 Tax=candidate division WWE3 bacterium TaxID=2053526 RepID=A0A955LGL3_UNCKA|nr:MBL fold metallo-hydrolase [candidate division WWE3 bacterium]